MKPSSLLISRHRGLRIVCWAIALLLLGDAAALMTHGMFNVGVIVPALLGGLLIALLCLRARIEQGLSASRAARMVWRAGWGIFFIWFIGLLVFFGELMSRSEATQAGIKPGLPPLQAIIVLGSSTRDGQPSATLALRLDTAARLANTQPGALIITSGGVDFGQQKSEGRVMADYLHAHHAIASDRLLPEEASTSTALNLALSMKLLQQRGIDPATVPIALVTSDFHTLRAGLIAAKAGYGDVVVIGAPTPLSIRFNAWLREYLAVMGGWVLQEF